MTADGQESMEAEAEADWPAAGFSLAALAVAGLLVLGGGYWAFSATLSGAVIAAGELSIEGERKTVQHLEGGMVEAILVRDGQTVEAGEVLMRLDSTALAAELEIVETRLDEAIAREARLDAERRGAAEITLLPGDLDRYRERDTAARSLLGQTALFEARLETQVQKRNRIEQRIQQTRSEIDGKRGVIDARQRQSTIAVDELKDKRRLFRRRVVPRDVVTRLEREVARIDGELNALKSEAAQAQGQIAELEIQILELASDYRERAALEQREAAADVAELRERRTALQASLDRVEIRSPISGVVLDLSVHTEGGVVSPAETLMQLVPVRSRLVVTAKIDPAQRDQIRLKQPARLLFPGFNQRTTPQLDGAVERIAADALTDPQRGVSYFPIEISVSDAELKRLRESIAVELSPGMPVEVHVRTGERTAASYLLKPLTDNFRRALTED